MATKKPNFVASSDAKVLADLLRNAEVGQVVTYEEMSEAIGREVTQDRSAIYTARAIVQREDRMIFDCVMKVGVKRLADADIVNLGDRARARVRKIASSVTKAITCVNYDSMSRESQVKHNTALSMFGVFSELSANKSFIKLQSHVSTVGTDLPVAKASIAALGLVFSK